MSKKALSSQAISYFCDGVKYSLADRDKVSQWLHIIARNEGNVLSALNIIFTTDRKLLDINKKFLGHNNHTDVITFPWKEEENLAGEIYISLDRVKGNARELGLSIKDELCRVMAHGLLHLTGMRDATAALRKAMRSREDFYLNLRPF